MRDILEKAPTPAIKGIIKLNIMEKACEQEEDEPTTQTG
jgi:hypothetical protein